MDNRKFPISVSVNPLEYSTSSTSSSTGSGRNVRLGNSDIREKMNQRMREFEEESRQWRDQFLSSSGLPQTSILDHRPRMLLNNFPEFPELTSSFGSPLSRLGGTPATTGGGVGFFNSPGALAQTSHKSFIEEDDHGNKKYKMLFEIGDFKPNEIQVKTEGRQLIVKGDRELVAGSATESKQFNREITLPDFIEPTSVTSFLSDGTLTIEAPVLLDRLGYSNNNAITNTSSSTSSTMRNSPFRDTGSPSRLGGTSLLSRNPFPRDDLLNLTSASPLSGFNTPFFNDTPSFSSHPSTSSINQSSLLNNSTTNNISSLNSNNNNNNNTLISNNSTATTMSSQVPTPSTPATYKFNMGEFRPEDIAITVTDTTLKIHAVREENDTRGNGKTYREFKREIGLPQGADVKRLKNSLLSDGTLTIEIPLQDNFNMRPQISPTGLNKQFSNFSLNENSSAAAAAAHQSSLNAAASTSSNLMQHQHQQQQQQQNNLINNNSDVNETNDGKELKLTFDLTGYKPEDLSIKVIDNNTLKVHAVHIDNSRGNQIHREYTRQYILPEWVQPELLRARMSDNGTLTVEIPLPQVTPSKLERVINIQNTNR